MPESIARIAVVLLTCAFGWAGIAKLVGLHRWRAVLGQYGLPASVAKAGTLLVPVTELAVAVTLVAFSARGGAIAVILCIALFSLAILRARSINGDRLPCGCFGGSAERHYRTMMLRNGGLGVLAAIVLVHRNELQPILPSMPTDGEVLPALLTLAGTVLVGWLAWYSSAAMRRHDH
jgi:hypothetical protein